MSLVYAGLPSLGHLDHNLLGDHSVPSSHVTIGVLGLQMCPITSGISTWVPGSGHQARTMPRFTC